MFGGLPRVFDEDPFFRDSHAAYRDHMHDIFSDHFGQSSGFPVKDGGRRFPDQRGRPDSRVALRDDHKAMSWSLLPFGSFGGMATSFPLMPFCSMAMDFPFMPFGCFGGMNVDFRDPFSTMDRMMSNMRESVMEMQRNFDKMTLNPNGHSFTSSSVLKYSKKGDEAPKVFQASAQTLTAPGGIKEIRKTVKDSESGLEKMAVGHHIFDRAHVVEKAKNNKTGHEEFNQDFINLDEAEAQAFDEEWQKEIMRSTPSGRRNNIDNRKPRNIGYVSREDGTRREKSHPKTAIAGPRKPASSVEKLNIKGSHVPLRSSRK